MRKKNKKILAFQSKTVFEPFFIKKTEKLIALTYPHISLTYDWKDRADRLIYNARVSDLSITILIEGA